MHGRILAAFFMPIRYTVLRKTVWESRKAHRLFLTLSGNVNLTQPITLRLTSKLIDLLHLE